MIIALDPAMSFGDTQNLSFVSNRLDDVPGQADDPLDVNVPSVMWVNGRHDVAAKDPVEVAVETTKQDVIRHGLDAGIEHRLHGAAIDLRAVTHFLPQIVQTATA